MVAVFNKELLSWYLITLKLKETVGTAVDGVVASPKPLPPPPQVEVDIDPEAANLIDCNDDDGGGCRLKSLMIREKLQQAGHDEVACEWAKLSIYKIPKSLRNGGGAGCDDKSFVPQLVSIGPYHHGKASLAEMERHKWRALHHVLHRTGHCVDLYLDAVRRLETRARACYEGGAADIPGDEFVLMMVLDCCFSLELFRGTAGEGFKQLGYCRQDPVFAMRGTMHTVQRDMIMLENQVPLFLLDRVFGLQIGQPEQTGMAGKLAIRFFDPLMPTDEPLIRKCDRRRRRPVIQSSNSLEGGGSGSSNGGGSSVFDPLCPTGQLHPLDAFRNSLLCTGAGPRQPVPRQSWLRRWSHVRRVADRRRQQLVHCVMELREAGVKFRRRRTDRFWDVRFADGELQMPRLLIHDGTKSLFLNLIAFEQCHMDCGNEITSYVVFMDNLINSGEDVAYLHYRGIVEHWLGNDDEVAELFNRLCQEVVYDTNDSYLSGLSEQVNRYYNHRWNAWRAVLKHKYFSSPWAIVSFAAAVVLLFLTFAQTFYSVYSFYRPPTAAPYSSSPSS